MFTAVGRATARRIQAPSAHPAAVAQLLLRQAPATSALPIRAFSASAPAQLPAASDKKSKATAKKPAAKKPAAKKTVEKPKAKPVKKNPVGRPKGPVDPEEEKKAEIRQLKKWALRDTPAQRPTSKWSQFITENREVLKGGLTSGMPDLATKFHSLSAAELNSLETVAIANREKNAADLKAWIKTHEPARIHIANQARRRLIKITDKHYKLFEDDRLPKKPLGSYTLFTSENWSRLGGRDVIDSSKTMSDAYKALSPSEKASYVERAAASSAKYEADMVAILARADEIKAELDPKSKK